MPAKSAAPVQKFVVPSQEQLKRLSEFVLRECAAGEVRSVLTIGQYLLGQLFHGSEKEFRSKDSNKPDSLNDLADQPGMKEARWSRTRLGNAIELALMGKAHNGFRAWRFLRVSHYDEVIGLPTERQRELLDRAEKEQWTVRRLREEAGKARPERPVVRRAATPQKALGEVRKAMGEVAPLADAKAALATSLVEAGIDVEATAAFASKMTECLEMLEGFQEQLEELKKRSAAQLKRVAGKVAVPG